MRKYKNLDVDRLLRLADTAIGDPVRGDQVKKRIETAKAILEVVALLTSIPQSQVEDADGD